MPQQSPLWSTALAVSLALHAVFLASCDSGGFAANLDGGRAVVVAGPAGHLAPQTSNAVTEYCGENDAGVDPVLDPQADLTLAYEAFPAVSGPLHGSATGVGWGGFWTAQSATSGEQVSASDGLAYPGLSTSGGHAQGAGHTSAGRVLAAMPQGPFDEYLANRTGTGYIGAPGKTLWASFLVRKNNNDDVATSVRLSRGASWSSDGTTPVRVGFFGNDSKRDGKRYWSLALVNDQSSAAGPVVQSMHEVEIGKVALIVLRMTFGETNEVAMFVNPPSLMTSPPASPSAVATTKGTLSFRSVAFFPGSGAAPASAIDELRVGRTYAAVTPRSGVQPYWAKPPQVSMPADSTMVCNRVRIFGRRNHGMLLISAKIIGSNSGETTSFENIGTLTYPPAEGAFTDYVFPANTKAFRYIKLISLPSGYVSAGEVEFYGGSKRLTGRAFGTTGSFMDASATFDKALDGDVETAFVGPTAADSYVGFDLGTSDTQASTPIFSPGQAAIDGNTMTINISTATVGASMRCTFDGSWPSATRGTPCSGDITITKAQTPGGRGKLALRAIAYKSGLFDSGVAAGNYYLNYSGVDVTTFHLGNSLTDTLNAHFAPISAATGKDHTYHRCTVPGAPSEYLWDSADRGCIGVGAWRPVYEDTSRYGILSHQSTQPSLGHGRSVENEGGYVLKFLQAARAGGSAHVQHWIYGTWPTKDLADRFSTAAAPLAPGDQYPFAQPGAANTYEKAALNHMAYVKSLKAWLDPRIAAEPAKYGTKPVKILPGPLAMYALLKNQHGGNLPAMLAANYEDGVHLKPAGAYYLSLVFYAAMFGETPEGKENTHFATLGLGEAQAKALQKLAWEVWSSFESNAAYWPNPLP